MKTILILMSLTVLLSACGAPGGPTGAQGSMGSTGPQGPSGTIGTPVQFCPGTTTYSGEFNEVGFCINGSIYAVYSANDGFLSEVPPGTYTSDGINASCTFTVGPNCEVTQ